MKRLTFISCYFSYSHFKPKPKEMLGWKVSYYVLFAFLIHSFNNHFLSAYHVHNSEQNPKIPFLAKITL